MIAGQAVAEAETVDEDEDEEVLVVGVEEVEEEIGRGVVGVGVGVEGPLSETDINNTFYLCKVSKPQNIWTYLLSFADFPAKEPPTPPPTAPPIITKSTTPRTIQKTLGRNPQYLFAVSFGATSIPSPRSS